MAPRVGFSLPTRLVWLSDRSFSAIVCGLCGPDTGSLRWLVKASSFGPHNLISCFSRAQCRLCLVPKEVVEVLDRRNRCRRPFIRPERLTTTVPIIANFKSPLGHKAEVAKYGTIKDYFVSKSYDAREDGLTSDTMPITR